MFVLSKGGPVCLSRLSVAVLQERTIMCISVSTKSGGSARILCLSRPEVVCRQERPMVLNYRLLNVCIQCFKHCCLH